MAHKYRLDTPLFHISMVIFYSVRLTIQYEREKSLEREREREVQGSHGE